MQINHRASLNVHGKGIEMNRRYVKEVLAVSLLGLLAWTSLGLAVEHNYNVSIGSNGQVEGGGGGHGGGRWYHYPNSGWYTQWFYNGPFNPHAYKTIEWSVRVQPINSYAASRITIAVNWTTDQWKSDQNPPLPSDFSGHPGREAELIRRKVVYEGPVTGAVGRGGSFRIEEYCPTWVSIDVKGSNVKLEDGVIIHECIEDVQYEYDYSDAPDPPYPTLKASNGASHFIDNRVYLGSAVDPEANGLPNANATGDDNNNLNDEDGVAFTSPLTPGSDATVDVEASAFGVLNAWIDFNADGDWDDAGEQIFSNQILFGGVSSLNFAVPTGAAPGQTFARFRFSSVVGLDYLGEAINGEVEDYAVRIERDQYQVGDTLKWEQPPIEYDPWAQTPVYCGWDQPAYVTVQGNYKGSYSATSDWKLVADDFRCIGTMPITSVHWWGSYVGWTERDYPSVRPAAFVLGFWTNVPATTSRPYSYPGELLHLVIVPADELDETWVGEDRFPNKPHDTCYKYTANLKPEQYFWQDRYIDSTRDRVFWLSVTALYQGTHGGLNHPWGWKTRPAHWMDDAVTFSIDSQRISSGYQPSGSSVQPIESSVVCQERESYDLAFALDTHPDYVKWDQPFTGLRDWAYYEDRVSTATWAGASSIAIKWEQRPDLSRTGVDVDATDDIPPTWPSQILADDFECTTPGPITGIDVWGSWFYDILPGGDANNVRFTINIHKDIPAHSSHTGYSMPGEILWTKEYATGEFSVRKENAELQSFYSPCTGWYIPNNHRDVYRYGFNIDADEAFQQKGTTQQPVVYWLSVQAYLVHAPGTVPTRWGWKTSTSEWNDVAVYAQTNDAGSADWKTLGYPSQHPYHQRKTGLSFRITTSDQSDHLTVKNQVADDWLCNSANPITAAVWWGSYKGYNYYACECQDQPKPRKPAFFWLSLWTDVPDPHPDDDSTYSRPAELVWQYKADKYDEVLVGYDRGPGQDGREAVYRYSVRIPKKNWFYQPGKKQVYWFSVVAVYPNGVSVPYPWGWTNHKHVYNDTAVTSLFPFEVPGYDSIFWSPLYDYTGAREDMSFILFTDPEEYGGN